MVRKAALLVVGLVALVGLLGCDNGNGRNDPWVQIASWEGRGRVNTETFDIPGPKWRIEWTLEDVGTWELPVACTIRVWEPEADYRTEYIRAETLTGESYVYHGPGTYYLEIHGGLQTHWAITVWVPVR